MDTPDGKPLRNSTRQLVAPDLLPWLEAMPDETWGPDMLPSRRALIIELASSGKPPLRPDVTLEERVIPGPLAAPDVRVVIVRPREPASLEPAILHFHGGGYVAGLPEMARATVASFAGEVGAVVVAVDYRLAPETRFPGALEDCYAALAWLHANAGALGIDPARIAVSGDSAGGGLAAGLALLARDRRRVRDCLPAPRVPGARRPYRGAHRLVAARRGVHLDAGQQRVRMDFVTGRTTRWPGRLAVRRARTSRKSGRTAARVHPGRCARPLRRRKRRVRASPLSGRRTLRAARVSRRTAWLYHGVARRRDEGA